ncbi:MAG: adenosylcobalamin-dependent ribonucleoside-diphosphate reductase, partial [Nitrospira sp.]|nr:adenosylcobalamin-dependent ribonucleoside-diphosphate reductase [Nitrospira sp.]
MGSGKPVLGGERDARQVFERMAGCWTHWGKSHGYFKTSEDSEAFHDEMCYMLARQMAAPNSPQWFNTGLHYAYGLSGPAQGHYYVDPKTHKVAKASNAFEHPQPHACFIQSVEDDLVNENGIMDLWIREARLFKYGSGTGTNFSQLRGDGEGLSGGGRSSGLMSFLRIGDRAAGAIKSGGTTRRAAKMVCLDLDHPDIEEFIEWKVVEEQKVAAMVTGSKICAQRLNAVLKACHLVDSEGCLKTNSVLREALASARRDMVPEAYIQRMFSYAQQGFTHFVFHEYDTNWDGKAYQTVSGQNSNNSVRIPNQFFSVLEADGDWQLKRRIDGKVCKTVKARDLWDRIAWAAWICADPGTQYDTTINEWHTCPDDGRINASNPCSEYMFLDDTACNLASLNLATFYTADGQFELEHFRHAVRLWTIALEISVLMASFPSRSIAEKSYEFRTLGLGYANMGTVLMRQGIPYDSPKALAICGAVTSIMTGESYSASAEMAAELSPFPGYAKNRDHMLRVIRNHRRAAYNTPREEYEGLTIVPAGIQPEHCDILAQKYFRKAGVPQQDQNGQPLRGSDGKPVLGGERDARQVFERMAGCWTHWGKSYGYFKTAEDSEAFHDEMCFMLARQMAAPNSPQWFNTGLHYAYGLSGPAQGHYYVDPKTHEVAKASNAFEHPQPHACFIQSVEDDLVNENGIMDLWIREARLFKYGSGTGTNFSQLRGDGEGLSGGGRSSGLMSFLRIGDRAAGAIKSGGTTRRAAKMVCLDLDHPDIEEFIEWKVVEEQKVAAMVTGSKICAQRLNAVLKACYMVDSEGTLNLALDHKTNSVLREALASARRDMVPEAYIQRMFSYAQQGFTHFVFHEYDTNWDGKAYQTVSGQNSNNSVRIPNQFFSVLETDGDWQLKRRIDGKVCKTVKARDLWDRIAWAAWICADPGTQYDTTINEWHTCPEDGRINASNPCSEYMFLDDTACNLASLNLATFYTSDGQFELEHFRHAVRLWTIALEISVLMASFPSRSIAEKSYEFRTLGLGYANMGTVLMRQGIPYDSPKALAICGAVTSIMTGESYSASAEMAAELSPFPGYAKNRDHMLRVIRNHRRAAYNAPREEYEGLTIVPAGIQPEHCPPDLLLAARRAWDHSLELGTAYGYRNAQVTVIAPTGTIGLVMDCDTTGIEPDFALVKFKKLAGGGYFKIINQSLPAALSTLGYTDEQAQDIVRYCVGAQTLKNAPFINHESLRLKGFDDAALARLEGNLAQAFEIQFVFNKFTFGEDFCLSKLGFTQ